MATEACKSNKIKVGERIVKPSYLLSVGETVFVQKNGFNLTFEVVKLIQKRVSATLAQPCYINHTSEEELNKFKDWFIGKGAAERREKGSGRPTKRERRELDEYKDDSYLWDE